MLETLQDPTPGRRQGKTLPQPTAHSPQPTAQTESPYEFRSYYSAESVDGQPGFRILSNFVFREMEYC